MVSWIFTMLVVVEASLSTALPTFSNEIVSILTPFSNISADIKERGSYVDSKPQKTLTSAKSDPKPTSQMECESDDDCHSSHYCYDTNVCASCYDCSVYFRLPSSSGCAKTPQMCGSCVQGYQNEILSGGKVRDTCTRIPTLPPEPDITDSSWSSLIGWIPAFGAIGLLVMIAIVLEDYRPCRANPVPSAPPLPTKDLDISRNLIEEPLVSDHERVNVVHTQAVRYDTSGETACCNGAHEVSSNTQYYTESSPEHQYGPSPPDLEDDSTIPSTWTPQTWSEGPLTNSFLGLLISQGNSNNTSSNTQNANNSVTPQHVSVQTFTPNGSFNDSEGNSTSSGESSSSSNSSTGSDGASPGPHVSRNVIVVQGGEGHTSVQVGFMFNNVQVNEY